MNAPSHRGTPSYWSGKVALVAGGSSGLGRAIAVELARQGARVAIAARGSSGIDATLEKMRAAGAEVLGIAADVTRQDDVDRLIDETVTQFGRLDVLVNAVGRSARGAALATTPEEFAAMLELNLMATVRVTAGAGPHLLRSRGHLINIGSLAAKFAGRYMGGYSASKFALAGYTQQLRLELADDGLKVLLVCPGPIVRDEVRQYETTDRALPASANRPGAGIRVRGMAADDVARRVLRAARHDRAELVLPARARLVFVAAAISPRLGYWLVRKLT
ncbi:MAG TPA: SDR family NAD(P)-dependent oxidoreductase [Pirellulales bacterium]|jgi:short-subunit dehydrogenase|nr:SDR family NAD(P)-dependent oxidoreductase [Pirellulales bacterium]